MKNKNFYVNRINLNPNQGLTIDDPIDMSRALSIKVAFSSDKYGEIEITADDDTLSIRSATHNLLIKPVANNLFEVKLENEK